MDNPTHRILHLAKLFLDLTKDDRALDDHYRTSRALTLLDDTMELVCLAIALHRNIDIGKSDRYPKDHIRKLCDGGRGIRISGRTQHYMETLHDRRNAIKHNGDFENAKCAAELMGRLESAMDEFLKEAGLNPLSTYKLSEAVDSPIARDFLQAAEAALRSGNDVEAHVEIRKLMYWLIERHACLVERLTDVSFEWATDESRLFRRSRHQLGPSDRLLASYARDLNWQAVNLNDIFSLVVMDPDAVSRELLLHGARPSDFFLIIAKTPAVFYDTRSEAWLVQYTHNLPVTIKANQPQILFSKALDIVTAWESHERLVDYRRDQDGSERPDGWMRGLYVDMETPAYRRADRTSPVVFTLKPGYSYKALRVTYGIADAMEYVEVEGMAYGEDGVVEEGTDRGYVLLDKIKGLYSDESDLAVRHPL